jgi:hypothetical protein
MKKTAGEFLRSTGGVLTMTGLAVAGVAIAVVAGESNDSERGGGAEKPSGIEDETGYTSPGDEMLESGTAEIPSSPDEVEQGEGVGLKKITTDDFIFQVPNDFDASKSDEETLTYVYSDDAKTRRDKTYLRVTLDGDLVDTDYLKEQLATREQNGMEITTETVHANGLTLTVHHIKAGFSGGEEMLAFTEGGDAVYRADVVLPMGAGEEATDIEEYYQHVLEVINASMEKR